MFEEDFLKEFEYIYYISYELDQLNFDDTSATILSKNKKDFKNLNNQEKIELRNKVLLWLTDYNEKFPGKIDIVKNNWLKVDWDND
jgi:hypothetical protein